MFLNTVYLINASEFTEDIYILIGFFRYTEIQAMIYIYQIIYPTAVAQRVSW